MNDTTNRISDAQFTETEIKSVAEFDAFEAATELPVEDAFEPDPQDATPALHGRAAAATLYVTAGGWPGPSTIRAINKTIEEAFTLLPEDADVPKFTGKQYGLMMLVAYIACQKGVQQGHEEMA